MNEYSVNEAKKAVKTGIKGYLLKDKEGNYFMEEVNRLPFYLEGAPGIGKTQMVSQIAKELGIGFVSFSITHHSRNTVLGLPVISEVNRQRYTEYTMSEIIAKVLEKYENGQKEGILLLDEFNCMSDTIMPVMLSFLQTKNIGSHTLPEGWVIVLCGNPSSYNKSARKFDNAILDRLRKLSIAFSSQDFLTYATEHHFEKEILEFVKMNPDYTYLCKNEKEDQIVTSRGWENLDICMKMLREIGEDLEEKTVLQFIKSEQVSRAFYKYYLMQKKITFANEDCEKILQGKEFTRYVQILSEMKLYTRLDILESLMKIICNKAQNKKVSSVECRDNIDHLIQIFEEIKDDTCLEKIYNRIKVEKVLMKVLNNHESQAYIRLIQKMYYGKTAV